MEENNNNGSNGVLFYVLRKWRGIVAFAMIVAILLGVAVAIYRAVLLNDDEARERWQVEYEVLNGAYWAEINDLKRQIEENERLASQKMLEIEKLDIKKKDYEGQLEDLAADIIYYESRIVDYEANIDQLELEREKIEYYLNYRTEQNEKSLLMQIDPYNVNFYDVYIRVDSGYEIIPENNYQNIDPTKEILQTYRLLVNNTSFYEKMIADLSLDTEVRYLTEVITIGEYNTNSLRVRVIGETADWTKMIGEYISDAILAEHNRVELSIAEHKIVKYNTVSYTEVDLDTYSKQYEFIQEAINYEAEIRDVNVSILNIEASIRDMKTIIRESGQDIDDINLAISELPLLANMMENEINGYHDANFALRNEQMELLDEPEPEYMGYTVLSIFTGFVKFAIIGGVLSAIIFVLYLVLMSSFGDKFRSFDKLTCFTGSDVFGFWPKSEKKRFDFIDSWIDVISGNKEKDMTDQTLKELVMANVAVARKDFKKILVCGGADRNTVSEIAAAIKEQIPELEVSFGGTLSFDPCVVREIAQCDAVILAEQLDRSEMKEIILTTDRAQSMGKSVLGVIAVR